MKQILSICFLLSLALTAHGADWRPLWDGKSLAGWHVIGRTAFSNFDPAGHPPTLIGSGDLIAFEIAR